MKKINYFFNFIKSYRFLFLKVLFFEIFYSLRFKNFIPLMKIHNHKSRTDTIPCIYYFIYKISEFIKKNQIISVVDVGSGYGRVVNSLSLLNKIKSHGVEFDREVHKHSLKIKKKNVKLYCGNIFDFKLSQFKSNCFILIDPFKKSKDRNKFLSRYKKIFKKKTKYLITVNILINKLHKNYHLIYSLYASKNRCLKIYKINPN
jgi:SAM-dependent methyltransferase